MSDASPGQGWWLASDGKWYPPAPIPPPPQPEPVVTPAPVWLGFAGAAAMFAGSFMPWATIGALGVAGTQGDGRLTILAALVVAVGAGLRKPWLLMVAASLGFAVAAWHLFDVLSDDGIFPVSPGMGLFVVGAGAMAAVSGGVLLASARK